MDTNGAIELAGVILSVLVPFGGWVYFRTAKRRRLIKDVSKIVDRYLSAKGTKAQVAARYDDSRIRLKALAKRAPEDDTRLSEAVQAVQTAMAGNEANPEAVRSAFKVLRRKRLAWNPF